MSELPPAYTADQIVKRYIELRNFVKDEKKKFADEMKQFTDAMEVLEGMADQLMKTTGQSALSTEFGTAFPVNKTRTKCTDRDRFIGWVITHKAWNFLTAHVAPEALDEWMEKHEGQTPDGIEVEGYRQIQFRTA